MLAALSMASMAAAGCGVVAGNDGPLTAREVLERAADATESVSSLRYTGEHYRGATLTLDDTPELTALQLHVEGTWAGGLNYSQIETHHRSWGRRIEVETVGREGLALQRRLDDPPTEWRPWQVTYPSGRLVYTPSYGVGEDYSDYAIDMAEGTLDGDPIYVVTIVRPLDVPDTHHAPEATMKLYIAKDSFLELGRDYAWDINDFYDLEMGPSTADEPDYYRSDFRFSDIGADLTVDFPPGWEDYEPTPTRDPRDPSLIPTPTPTRTPTPVP